VIEYAVVVAGETINDPAVEVAAVHAAEHAVALEEIQERVELAPRTIVVGCAVKVTEIEPPPPPPPFPMVMTRVSVSVPQEFDAAITTENVPVSEGVPEIVAP
jgi:hypothetical protein